MRRTLSQTLRGSCDAEPGSVAGQAVSGVCAAALACKASRTAGVSQAPPPSSKRLRPAASCSVPPKVEKQAWLAVTRFICASSTTSGVGTTSTMDCASTRAPRAAASRARSRSVTSEKVSTTPSITLSTVR
jgi:hypothetical protein